MNRIHATHAPRRSGAWSFVCAGMRIGRLPQGLGEQPHPGRDVLAQVKTT